MKLSIVTINYNNTEGLRRTIESVISQTCNDFQYIIIDGGSTDGSKDIIEKYSAKIDYWVSERDSGIYNAMNKGITKATGEYVLLLNSGDCLYDEKTIEKVIPMLGLSDFMTGDSYTTLPNGKSSVWRAPRIISIYLMAMYSLSHQATFIHTSLLKNRPYREDLKIVGDWEEMFSEIVINNRTYTRIDLPICRYEFGGVSYSNVDTRESERSKVLHEHFSDFVIKELTSPNLLMRIAGLSEEGTRYYRVLELFARIIRRLFHHK